jgi:hypothetical protein
MSEEWRFALVLMLIISAVVALIVLGWSVVAPR